MFIFTVLDGWVYCVEFQWIRRRGNLEVWSKSALGTWSLYLWWVSGIVHRSWSLYLYEWAELCGDRSGLFRSLYLANPGDFPGSLNHIVEQLISIGHINEYPTNDALFRNFLTHCEILTEYFWKFQWKIALWECCLLDQVRSILLELELLPLNLLI